jgi:NADH-ubiquinone oxidoreductase chain 5
LRGFYSKDIILEIILITSTNPILALLFYSAVRLTVAYTVRFIILTRIGGLINSGRIVGADNDNLINLSMAALWPLAIAGGRGLT